MPYAASRQSQTTRIAILPSIRETRRLQKGRHAERQTTADTPLPEMVTHAAPPLHRRRGWPSRWFGAP